MTHARIVIKMYTGFTFTHVTPTDQLSPPKLGRSYEFQLQPTHRIVAQDDAQK